jgi:hypothetical protein
MRTPGLTNLADKFINGSIPCLRPALSGGNNE